MSLLSIKFSTEQDRFLREFLQRSFLEQAFTDCNLHCWTDERTGLPSPTQSAASRMYRTFKCHRLVLSAHSDFFRHCFLDTAKSDVSSVFLDIEPRTLESILRLIYFGQIEIAQSDFELFFNAATKLGLRDFKLANSNEVFNVDSDLNHLKRRLTQDESMSLKASSKSAKFTDHNSLMDSPLLHKDQECANEELNLRREEARCQEVVEKVGISGEFANSPVILPKLNFAPMPAAAGESSPAQQPQQDGSGAPFTCTICNKQYSYKISLNKHIKSAHAN